MPQINLGIICTLCKTLWQIINIWLTYLGISNIKQNLLEKLKSKNTQYGNPITSNDIRSLVTLESHTVQTLY